MKEIVIVGGGASGLAAALTAAQADPTAHVTVLERLDRVGKKILSTGNGRCNLGNAEITPEHYHSADPKRLTEMLATMPAEASTDFFAQLGLLCRTEEVSGRIYPYSNQATAVLDVLLMALRRREVEVCCGTRVSEICTQDGQFLIKTQNGTRKAQRVILAAGGLAAPKLGTDGDGFALARQLGHSCLPAYPCLVALRCKGAELAGLKGIRVQGTATLFSGKTRLSQSRGELQLTEYGVSGIPAMELSCEMNRAGAGVEIRLDLFPDWTYPELRAFLAARAGEYARESLEDFLPGLLNKKVGYAILKRCGIAPLSRPAGSLRREELDALTKTLKGWSFPVIEALSWDKAQCTGGGVPLSEVDAHTMESQLRQGLFLTGEVLDAVGNCGGFNLHWAWCTGMAAGRAAAQK